MSEKTESMLFTVAKVEGRDTVTVKFKYGGKLYGTYVQIDDRTEDTLREALGLMLGVALDMMRSLDEQADEGAGDPG